MNQEEYVLIVAGGRDFNDYGLLQEALFDLCLEGELKDKSVSIMSGGARGADALGEHFAIKHSVRLHRKPADWDQYGKRAGFIRNEEMAHASQGLLAFWDGKSKGTKHMIDTMRALDKPVWIINY